MLTTTQYTENIEISSDKRWHTRLADDDYTETRAVALHVACFLMRSSYYVTPQAWQNIKTMLGKKWSNVNEYINTFPPGDLSPSGIQQWNFMLNSIDLSLETCLYLQNLILNNNAIIILNDADCFSDGTRLVCHRITVEAYGSHQNAIVNEKLMLLRNTLNYSTISLLAISKTAWNRIQKATDSFRS